ncbi:MAG: M48 family metalloprotease [Sphingomicrobium sp.]
MRRSFLWLAVAALAITPAAAQQGRYLNPQDVANAQRQHAAMVQEFGGAETGPRAAYVDLIGRRVGAYSGLAQPAQQLHFTTLNSPVENAFSVPGGYIYVTRQLLAIMNDESELAFALAHEIGHVAANHARIREAYARRNPYGVFGQIVGAVLGQSVLGNVIAQRAQLDTLSFSREQEYQADTLGLHYIMAAGYDPAGAAGILAALSRATAMEARVQGRSNRQTPEWARTHPLSENRMQRALQEARATGRLGDGVRNRDLYLNQLEGVFVDDDPAQGIIDGPTFTHPDLRIKFTVPTGYLMSNGTTAVGVSGSAGRAQFGGGRFAGSLEDYTQLVYRDLTRGQFQLMTGPSQRVSINGMPATVTTARYNSQSGPIDASVVAYQWDSQRVYHFIMLTPGGSGLGPFASMVNSLRRISAQEAAAIRPRIIHVETVRPGDTVQSLASHMVYRDLKVDRFLALNGLQPGSVLRPGEKVKIVVYGNRTLPRSRAT